MPTPVKLTLRLPPGLHQQLKQRAQVHNLSLNKVIVETLRDGLSQQTGYEISPEERVWRTLRERGLWEPIGSEWDQLIAEGPDLSLEELREMLKDVPPLSDAIIEEREPR